MCLQTPHPTWTAVALLSICVWWAWPSNSSCAPMHWGPLGQVTSSRKEERRELWRGKITLPPLTRFKHNQCLSVHSFWKHLYTMKAMLNSEGLAFAHKQKSDFGWAGLLALVAIVTGRMKLQKLKSIWDGFITFYLLLWVIKDSPSPIKVLSLRYM